MSEALNPRWVIWRDTTGEALNYQFMAWIGRRWAEWCELNERNRDHPKSKQDHADFDAWLSARK